MGDVNDQHEHLKNMIEKSSIPWTYAILWECSSQRRVLRFKDGYHRGSIKPKEVRIMGSGGTVAENTTDYDAASEWFFKISMNQYFEINEDLPGYALIVSSPVWINAEDRDGDQRYKWGMWERTKWAHNYGIRTFLCIHYCIEWIQHNVHLIHPIGTPSSPLDYPQQQQQQQQQLLLAQQQRQQLRQRIEQQQKLLERKHHQQHLFAQQQVFRLFPEQQRQQLRQLIEQQQKLLERKLHQQLLFTQQQGLRLFPEQHVLRRNDAQLIFDLRDELNEEPDEEAVNELKNRGKEKISNSKCSWTILTESSDRGTDTFSCSHDYSGPS